MAHPEHAEMVKQGKEAIAACGWHIYPNISIGETLTCGEPGCPDFAAR